MVVVQLTMISVIGWLLTVTVAALGNKELAGLMKAATIFALVALGAEWLHGLVFAEVKPSIFTLIWNLFN